MRIKNKKSTVFLMFVAAAILMAYRPLRELLWDDRLALYYSHIPLIPVISAYLLLKERKKIFAKSCSVNFRGLFIMAVGVSSCILLNARQAPLEQNAVATTLVALIFLWSSFLFFWGIDALKKARFPLLFLLFAVPVPPVIMDRIVAAIVVLSTNITQAIFKEIGVPLVREGLVFDLPIFSLEMGPECAGLRSSVALIIISMLAGHLFIGKLWKKLLLVIVAVPLAIIKNGVRVVVLYLISYFIDMRFMEGGFLHRSIGYFVFLLSLSILGFFFWRLREPGSEKLER